MFTALLKYITLPSHLKESYEKISKLSSGIDEVSYREFESNLMENIEALSKDISMGLYSPEPLKKIEIDKPNSDKKRPIALSAIKDKILNKNEPIKLNSKGLLTKPSRELISKNIKEKLGSYTMYKKESRKIENSSFG